MAQTTTRQKLILVIFGIILSLLILELLLRVGGVMYDFTRVSLDYDKEKSADYTILCIGESTTELGGIDSWPKQLEEILNNQSDSIRFNVVNRGLPGTNTAFLLDGIDDAIEKYDPDLVISMMGVNDGNLKIRFDEGKKLKIAQLMDRIRILRLANLLYSSFKKRWSDNDQKNSIEKRTGYNIKEYKEYAEIGFGYTQAKKYKEAEELYASVIDDNPNESLAYFLLAQLYHEEMRTNYKEAEQLYLKSIELNPKHKEAYWRLGTLYVDLKRFSEARKIIEKAIDIGPVYNYAYFILGELYYQEGYPPEKIHKFYEENGYSIMYKETEPFENTKYHYIKLYEILSERGIKYIAMQYPTLDINIIRQMFKGGENIIFVSNEFNFKNALHRYSYDELFTDNFANQENNLFAGNYGHATRFGNRLIAENVADVIFNNIEA
ncbi:tetratricopeptide repeat protein [Candidatus Woesearchaeota archaeon]|nr:tetratricopeptide repeat protein [Candidatus Woesearchaeota archaeon]